ncbi:MAG: PQQ-dependent sugar dehydrogenase, partial [Candidatus Binatia bacterium]
IGSLDIDAAEGQVASLSPVCGDSILGPTQQCDGGDDLACPGLCNSSCACVFPPDCGDGNAVLPEECDDSNQMNGDGCSSSCTLEDASALCAGVPSAAGTAIDAVLVSAAFIAPIHATAPPLDPSRLFVVEREGRIRILNLADNTIEATPFLDIVDIVDTAGEGGLLSMAFDPAYDTNRRFFVYYTNNSGNIEIARYETLLADPNVADESTAQLVLGISHPFASNHNGGQLAFGADGYLYAATGDGGTGGDNAQDDGSMLGKVLRFDVAVDAPPYFAVPPTNPGYVDGSSQLELIWAKGLRNPWRFSFDKSTGDMLTADVGQNSLEEINFQAASSTGGENYGWDIFEGTSCHDPDPLPMCPAPPTGFTMPIHEYSHALGCSITGGFVYRGCAMPDLAANYFYSDYCTPFLRTVEISGGAAINPVNRTSDATDGGATLNNILSFGEDARGEIYILRQNGVVYRIEPE